MVELGDAPVNLPQIREGGHKVITKRNAFADRVGTEQQLRGDSLKYYTTSLHKVTEPFRTPLHRTRQGKLELASNKTNSTVWQK